MDLNSWIIIGVCVVAVVIFIAVLALVLNHTSENNVTFASEPISKAIVTVIPNGRLLSSNDSIFETSAGMSVVGQGILFNTITSLSLPATQVEQFQFVMNTESVLIPRTDLSIQDNNSSTVRPYSFEFDRLLGAPPPPQTDLYVVANAAYIYNLKNDDGTVQYKNYYMDTTSDWSGSTDGDVTATVNVYSGDVANPEYLGSFTTTVRVMPFGSYTPTFRAALDPTPPPPLAAYPTLVLPDALAKVATNGWMTTFNFLTVQINKPVYIRTATVFSPIQGEETTTTTPVTSSMVQTQPPSDPSGTITSFDPEVPPSTNADVALATENQTDGTVVQRATTVLPNETFRTKIAFTPLDPSNPAIDDPIVLAYDVDLSTIVDNAFPSFDINSGTIVTVNPSYETVFSFYDTDGNVVIVSAPPLDLTASFTVSRDLAALSRLRTMLLNSRAITTPIKVRVTVTGLTARKLLQINSDLPSGLKDAFLLEPQISFTRDIGSGLSTTMTNNVNVCGG